jgi:hypothetical protein
MLSHEKISHFRFRSDVMVWCGDAFSEVSAEFSLAATFFLRLKEFMMELHIS